MHQINDYLATFLLPSPSFTNRNNPINESNQERTFDRILSNRINNYSNSNNLSSISLPDTDSNSLSSLFLPSTIGNMPSSFGKDSLEQFTQTPSYDQVNKAYQKNGVTEDNRTPLTKQPTNEKFNQLIDEAAQKYGVDANLIHSIIKTESNYNPHVTSHAGATGLMQLMPETAKAVGITNRNDIAQNIDGGTHYFSKMLKEQKGDVRMALAAYNAGPGNVKKYGGVPPFKETQNYIRKVMEHYKA